GDFRWCRDRRKAPSPPSLLPIRSSTSGQRGPPPKPRPPARPQTSRGRSGRSWWRPRATRCPRCLSSRSRCSRSSCRMAAWTRCPWRTSWRCSAARSLVPPRTPTPLGTSWWCCSTSPTRRVGRARRGVPPLAAQSCRRLGDRTGD
ncbi:unnamed protein product, partial [Prorocentrum cordatum]